MRWQRVRFSIIPMWSNSRSHMVFSFSMQIHHSRPDPKVFVAVFELALSMAEHQTRDMKQRLKRNRVRSWIVQISVISSIFHTVTTTCKCVDNAFVSRLFRCEVIVDRIWFSPFPCKFTIQDLTPRCAWWIRAGYREKTAHSVGYENLASMVFASRFSSAGWN